jgi:hypothetical protein
VLVSRPIAEGLAISCQVEGWGIIELRFYARSDDTIFLVDKLGEEVIVGVLDDDGVQDKIAGTIVGKYCSHILSTAREHSCWERSFTAGTTYNGSALTPRALCATNEQQR